MAWQFNRSEAVFLQIARRLRNDILSKKFPTDKQFPTVRMLASEAAVNPNTMQKALSQLESEGLLYTRGTIGRFVTKDEETLQAATRKAHENAMRTLLD